MTWGDDALVVLPATLPLDELKRRLALADAAVIMKIGRNFARAKEALVAAGMAERAIYVERATMAGEVVTPLVREAGRCRALFLDHPRAGQGAAAVSGRVMIVGLGPGPGRMDDAGGERGDRGGERRRRLRPLCRAARLAAGPARPCERQSGRNGPRPARLEARGGRPCGRGRLGRRSGRVRHGGGGVRGDRGGSGMARARHSGRARRDRDAGGGGPARRAARPRLLRHLALRQSQALGDRRAPAPRGGRGRFRHRALQPGLEGEAGPASSKPSTCCGA